MTGHIDCVFKADHLLVTAKGPWTEKFVRKLIDTGKNAAIEHDTTRILVDMCEISPPEYEFTRFLSGKYFAEVMGPRFRVAAFGRPENVTHYAETVAQNRGASLMAFADEKMALDWLMRED